MPSVPPLTVFKPKAGSTARLAGVVDTEELADILMKIQRRFLANLSRELGRGNVSFVQFFLLGTLAQEEVLTMSEIALRMGHTTAAATGLVDRLEALSYVGRAHAKDDRRKVRVEITAKGLELVTRIKRDMVANLDAAMTHLTATEQKAWLQIYRKINVLCQTIDSRTE